jgi:hypothetical protein
MARKNGVDLALDKAGGGPEAFKRIADLFEPPISVPAIYKFRRQGWFPFDRAKVVAQAYGLPLADLVRADIREALLANNS